MNVVYLGRDLMIGSRIVAAADAADAEVMRISDPLDLPDPDVVNLVLVDWSDRQPDWGSRITKWCALAPGGRVPRIILFGPHVDLDAHSAARAAGLGPMWARSRLLGSLSDVLNSTPPSVERSLGRTVENP